jgi:hypothetical protein
MSMEMYEKNMYLSNLYRKLDEAEQSIKRRRDYCKLI